MRRFRPRADPQQLRDWLTARVGWSRAQVLIRQEAQILGTAPDSDVAVKHAVATYTANTGESPSKNPLTANQEGLLP